MIESPVWMERSLLVLVQAVMLVGLFGSLVPFFPGLLIIWLAALGYGLIAGFGTLGTVLFILTTLLLVAGMLVDNLLAGYGAFQGGASWLSITVALLAFMAGTIFFPPLGGLIAAPLAVLLLEFVRKKNMRQAWLAVRGLAAGWGVSYAIRFVIGIVMILFWWLWVLKG
ncbi:MAG: DUF456 domain-containing protein [Anaerolineales bacterium]